MQDNIIKYSIKELLEQAIKAAQEQNNNNGQKKPDLITEFESIDEKYGTGEELAKYSLPTDAELEAAAQKEFEDYYIKGAEKIKDTAQKAYISLEESRENASKKMEDKQKNIDASYEDKAKKLQGDIIKQGIARSSIAEQSKQILESGKEKDKLSALNDYYDTVKSIDAGIEKLEKERQSSQAQLDTEYAQKIDKQLEKLHSQREKQIEQILKEEKKQREAALTFCKEEKLAAAKKYYDGMSKNDAITHFTSNEYLKEHLGDYYQYMLNYLKNKKE